MWSEAYGDPALEELAAARDSDELCRLLVRSPWGWGSSTRYQEAVSLRRGLDGRGTLPGSLVALLLAYQAHAHIPQSTADATQALT